MSRLTVDGAELHYEIEGTGPPIALIHGYTAHLESWAFQRGPFAAQRRLLLWDLPGHGRSSFSPDLRGPLTIERFADHLAALLDHLGIERAHVGGISMGGMIALAFALRHPGRLRSLLLADTAAVRMPFAMRLAFELMAFLGRLGLRAPARNIAFPGLGRRLPSDNEHLDSPERALVEAGVSRHEHPRQVLCCAVAAARKRDDTPRLGEIAVPTLVVVGAEDPVRPLAEDMQRRIAGSTLAVIPGSPHGTAVTCPKAFNRIALEFYDRVDGRSSSMASPPASPLAEEDR